VKKRVLVIDDQKLICDVTERWLSNNGYEVLRAYDSKTGYNIIDNDKPDLVLIDILLPGISGIELCEKVRQVDNLKHIPLVLMSAVYKDRALLNQINNIADDFIEKPFKENELISKVNQFLKPPNLIENQKKDDEIEVEYVENSIDKITYEDNVPATSASPPPPPSELPEADEAADEKKQESPDKTVQLDLNDDLNFEYTDPGLLQEEPPASPPPGASEDDEVVMLNLAPIKKESDEKADKPVQEKNTNEAKKKGSTDRLVEEELENLFKIVKDK
jgi:CheY-like chemotaxis protein